jgi:hypothetical protein
MPDKVTSETWLKVMARDKLRVLRAALELEPFYEPRLKGRCIAWVLDPDQKCSGRYTIDHVNEYAMRGKRAPSDLAHMVMLCEHHHLDYYEGGRNWATSHRQELREYLKGAK